MFLVREKAMNEFFPRLFAASLICVGIWNLFGNGMILGWLGNIWEKRLPDAINMPLWSCPPCMASVHGTWVWFYLGGDVAMWVPFCLALCGCNKLLSDNLLH
jgi:hypothetical protein